MYHSTANKYGTRRTAVTPIAALVCVLFVAVFLLSPAFIALHAHHEHDQDGADGGCATCAHIAAAGDLLKTVAVAAAIAACADCLYFGVLPVLKAARHFVAAHTLIGLKVRIDS
jgi:hypothetical protein